MIPILVTIINWIFKVLIFGLFIYTLLTYFLSDSNPVRRFLARIFEPMLRPIQRILPPLGGFDLSPVVLMLIFWLLNYLIITILGLFR